MNENKSNEYATNELLITTKNSNSQDDNDKEILNKCTKDQVIFLYGKLKEGSSREISQLKAENERLKNVCNEFVYGEENPKYYKTMDEKIEKLKDLVSRSKPCMEYIHSKLPEESEVLDKYRKWNKEAEEALNE